MPFEIVRNDITRMKVDAIVNAANRSLLGGGGVDGAIHAAAGPGLLEECRKLHGCETGQAKITKGYRLPAGYVIHTVGPVWHGGDHQERELLSSCYRNALRLADEYRCESVAFPLISAGAYGYPREEAMDVAVEAITSFLLHHEMMVYLVVFGRSEFFTGKKLFQNVQEFIDDNYADRRVKNSVRYARKTLWHDDEEKALELESLLYTDAMTTAAPMDAASIEAAPIEAEDAAPAAADTAAPAALEKSAKPDMDWKKLIRMTDEGFSQALLRLIDERGMTDVQCYKRANVDRRLFSKIRSDPHYSPSKPTVFAFAIALRLNLSETRSLLQKAGFALTHSNKLDVVLEYCIRERFYDVLQINEVLFELDLPLLGNNSNVA